VETARAVPYVELSREKAVDTLFLVRGCQRRLLPRGRWKGIGLRTSESPGEIPGVIGRELPGLALKA